MSKIEFSVSMCVYGKDDSRHFDVALNSVIEQTVTPSEIVLTVDGPVPVEIDNIIDKYQNILGKTEIRFEVIRLEKNVGHGEARRICFDNCSFPIIAIMDADDLSVSDRFEKQICYLRAHEDVSVVGGYITEFINKDDPKDVSQKAGRRIVPLDDENIKTYMKKRCPLNQVSVAFRKKDIEEVGGYIDWYCEEDYYLWIRLALAGKKLGNIGESLVNVRVGKEMYQRRGGWKYFKSEIKLQWFMFRSNMIDITRFFINSIERFILQVLVPCRIRGWMFQKLARE